MKHASALRAGTIAIAAALLLAGCSTHSNPPSTAGGSTRKALSGSLTVYAAASLTASFDDLAKQFEKANPGVDVKPIDYDGSSTLATQIIGGAPADVFASADKANMDKVSQPSLTSATPSVFASNTLQIAVAPDNPKKITGLKDLSNAALKVVLCAPEVPCGAASHTLLNADGITVKPVSEEQNVTAVVTKVASGDADAGLVYVTDVTAAAGKVDGVTIPDADKAVNQYYIAPMKSAPNPAAAKAFIAFVLSAKGQSVLAKYGFARP